MVLPLAGGVVILGVPISYITIIAIAWIIRSKVIDGLSGIQDTVTKAMSKK
jgi:hypothetical protein